MTWPVKDADLAKLGKSILKGAKGLVTGADVQFGAGDDPLGALDDRLAELLQVGVLHRPGHRMMVPVRRIFFCNCSTP